jgi:type VI secretion system protein ImpE
MIAKQLFQDGRVREAQQALGAWLRTRPEDAAARTFLFELLCFSGDWDRAARQLDVLSEGSQPAELGAMLYRSAIHAERSRHEMPTEADAPGAEAPVSLSGTIDGRAFQNIRDADPATGARLEFFAAGAYRRISFAHIRSIRIEAPKRLRDTLWIPAIIETSPSLHDGHLGEVLLPALYPFSWKHSREAVWLGRETIWSEERPLGQKTLLVDDEEVPLLEVRELEIAMSQAAAHE